MAIGITRPADGQVMAKPVLVLSLSPLVLSVITAKSMMPFAKQDREREKGRREYRRRSLEPSQEPDEGVRAF